MERGMFIAALAIYTVGLVFRIRDPEHRLARPLVVGVGAVLHLAGMVMAVVLAGRVLTDSMSWGLGALALLVVGGSSFLRRAASMEAASTLLLPIGMLLLLAAAVAPGPTTAEEASTVWIPVHVAFIFTGLASFAAAFSLSVLYLFVRRRLKQRRLDGLARLPSLDALDTANLRAMAVGFVTLTAGAAVVVVWALTVPDAEPEADITVYATVAVWVWYAAALHARLVAGWRGRQAAIFGVVGFAGLALLLIGVAVAFQGFHGFGGAP